MKPLIYTSYDYYDSNVSPLWIEEVTTVFGEGSVYNPRVPLVSQGFTDGVMKSLPLPTEVSEGLLKVLGFPPILLQEYNDIKDDLQQAEHDGARGYVVAMLLIHHYMLVRSSLVIVDGNVTFGSGPATDLLLATQLRKPTILVCDREVVPPWLMAYTDVTVMSSKLIPLVHMMHNVRRQDTLPEDSNTPQETPQES